MKRATIVSRYLITTFGITWSAWWALARLGGTSEGPAPLLFVGGAGPVVAALVVRDAEERRDLLRRTAAVTALRSGWGPVVAVGVGPAAVAAIAATLSGDADGVTC